MVNQTLSLLAVKLLESLGEARVQVASSVRRLEVGCCTHQGFNTGHKFLEMYEVLGSVMQCLQASMTGKSEEMNFLRSFMEFEAKHLTPS